mmetsp:Transcript_8077/g.22478  ORF Transcript_8077/g.22478 Transcript_8077/m.22478 type:complete len:205 (-) Transcript_8077:81-695(-)
MVFGTPMTLVLQPLALKYSANTALNVLEPSPPTTTRPSRPMALQTAMGCLSCSSVSILCLPLPSMSKPSVLRKPFTISAVTSTKLPLMTPWGPSKKPITLDSSCHCFRPSKRPAITLWPPGACPPESITPTLTGLQPAGSPPQELAANSTEGASYVLGKSALTFSESFAEAGTASLQRTSGRPSSTLGKYSRQSAASRWCCRAL